MARKSTGQVMPPKGRQKSWAIRFRAYGERHYVSLGRPEDGYTREQAEAELAYTLAAIERGHWRPQPTEPERVDGEPGLGPDFHSFASAWFDSLQHEALSPHTISDYEWQLTHHLLPFFARHRLGEITIAEVDRYRQAQVAEGRLSPTSINKTITGLGRILDIAAERELIDRNPVRINPRRRKLKRRKPQRSYLDRPDQIASLLDAAGELDDEARDRASIPRRTLLATLAFTGLRIGEALALAWGSIDLAAGRLRVGHSKTDAGTGREIDLVPALRDELAAHKATAQRSGDADLVFPTGTGQAENPSNVRNRILAPAIKRANERRAEAGLAPLPERLTQHSMRRTFISILFALGYELPVVMAQVGHADPRVTLSVYAAVMLRGEDERARLRAAVEGVEPEPVIGQNRADNPIPTFPPR
jgi:integrase